MKMRITLAALLVLAVALTGCMGESVAPTDPAPAAPQGLTLGTQGTTTMLQWQPNGESDLAGYQICRAAVRVGQTSQVAAVTAAPVAENEYPVPSDTGHWLYYVRAIDSAGNLSALSAPITVIFSGGNETPSDEGTVNR